MKEKEQVIKHLELIQEVINRLARDSFLIKGWSMTILSIAILFLSRNPGESQWLIFCFFILVIGFWILDGYFLWQERLFRKVYDEIRKQESTDFGMNPMKHVNQPKCKWIHSMFSETLLLFYGLEAIFVLVAFEISR